MPIDRFNEVPSKVGRGDVITTTSYYGTGSSVKNTNYPRRMDFEVLRWPTSASLRSFAYYFTAYWLDSVLLPLQSSEIKWHKMVIRLPNTEQYFQIPLVGKYGHYNGGGQTPLFEKGKQFGVSLIPSHSSKSTKTFRLRGVADAYEMFDRETWSGGKPS